MPPTRLRYRQIRVADDTDDQKTAGQIVTGATGGSITQEDFQEYVLSQVKRILYGDHPGHWYNDFETDGIKSLSDITAAGEEVGRVSFDYTNAPSMILGSVSTGNLIDRAIVFVMTPFDGGATIQFGTTGSTGLFLAASDIEAEMTGQFESHLLTLVPVNDLLVLSIGGSPTQGTGLLLYKLRR